MGRALPTGLDGYILYRIEQACKRLETGRNVSEEPWLTKSQIMVALGKSSRTIDLWVKAGKIERMQDGSRAYFRRATPGNPVTTTTSTPQSIQASPELEKILLEIRDELRALRADNEKLRADLLKLEAGEVRNAPRKSWWKRFLYGP